MSKNDRLPNRPCTRREAEIRVCYLTVAYFLPFPLLVDIDCGCFNCDCFPLFWQNGNGSV